jgi:immune inhibitor A
MNIKRFYSLVFLMIFFCCAGLCGPAWAVPAAPIVHELTQPDGTKIKAVKWGDEHRHGWETEDGYAIRLDEQSRHWKYVTRDGAGKSFILPERAGIDQPPPSLQRHIERNYIQTDSPRGWGKKLSPSRKVVPSTGTGNVLVILINFNNTSTSFTGTHFTTLLFGNANNSMKDYYEEVSYGVFTVSPGASGIAGWYTASQNHDYYGANKDGNGDDAYPGTLVREAVIAADAAGFNFAPYDQDNDSYVDQVAIVHQGTGEEASSNAGDIWSHSWDLESAYWYGYSNGGEYLTNDGVKVNSYIIMPEIYDGDISTMGVFAHEYGHALGLPDLYDTASNATSEGIGEWSIMAGGSWNGVSRQGDRPAHMDAWCKYYLGWVTPTLVSSAHDNITIARASENADVYQFLAGSPDAGEEYFLVENRQRTTGSFDEALPGAGLLIWHIDESKNSGNNNNNNFECLTGPGSPSCVSNHYHVALMQADGLWNLEKGNNRGDAGDPFPGNSNNRTFGYGTSPSSSLWSGAPSNVAISSISNSGPVMSFNFRNASTSSTTTSITTTTSMPITTTTTTANFVCIDNDGDGYGVGAGCVREQDCDDTDADLNPGADEVCGDGIDNNCDGETDEGCNFKCPFVQVLGEDNPRLAAVRSFRDSKLAKSAFGRMIIRLYYGNAEWVSEAIERNPGMKAAVKKIFETAIPPGR